MASCFLPVSLHCPSVSGKSPSLRNGAPHNVVAGTRNAACRFSWPHGPCTPLRERKGEAACQTSKLQSLNPRSPSPRSRVQSGSRVMVRAVSQAPPGADPTAESPASDEPVPQPILVAGAGGGVGQLVVAALLERGYKVKALLRTPEKAQAMFGDAIGEGALEPISADLRDLESLSDKFEGVGSVVVCTGTTAFPSKRWDGGNGPEQTDVVGNRNLLSSLPPTVKRIVFVSSVGVTRFNQLPFNILNLFGVLRCKREAEEMVERSGIPYTILRPGRLTDGPYTSYDLNTLLKATSGARRAAVVAKGDTLNGEASRILVAEACVQALALPVTVGNAYCINSTEGEGPGKDSKKWAQIFEQLE